MPNSPKKLQIVVWGGLALILVAITAAFLLSPPTIKPLPVLGTVPEFTLTNENGAAVSLADWKGQIHVVDLIFTRCAGQCLLMDATYQKLQDSLPASPTVKMVSLTSDPVYDTPPVLKQYGQKFHANPAEWTFLTGPKEQMRHLVMDGLLLAFAEKKPADQETPVDLFIHSTKLVLVDTQGRIRGYFDGETTDCIPPLLAAIQALGLEK